MNKPEVLETLLKKSVGDAQEAISFLSSEAALSFMKDVALLLASTFQSGHKVLIAGNGGSLCDAAHFAEELTGCFRERRRALPAIVLSEPGHLTCVGNDFGFDQVFARGVEAFGTEGDLFIALTTSGNSKNILLAVEEAKKRGMKVVAFLGKGGGALLGKCDHELIVPKATTSDRIQEVHMAALHIIIEGVESVI
jgi:D-sedoheptulose 7-phosphate isomerase